MQRSLLLSVLPHARQSLALAPTHVSHPGHKAPAASSRCCASRQPARPAWLAPWSARPITTTPPANLPRSNVKAGQNLEGQPRPRPHGIPFPSKAHRLKDRSWPGQMTQGHALRTSRCELYPANYGRWECHLPWWQVALAHRLRRYLLGPAIHAYPSASFCHQNWISDPPRCSKYSTVTLWRPAGTCTSLQ
jgi:hypothetical protein